MVVEIISILVAVVAVVIAGYSARQSHDASINARKTYKEARNQTVLLLNQIAAQWSLDIQVTFEEGAIENQLERGPVVTNSGRGSGIVYEYRMSGIELNDMIGSGFKVKAGTPEEFREGLHQQSDGDSEINQARLSQLIDEIKKADDVDLVLKYYSIESRITYTQTQKFAYDKSRNTLKARGEAKISKDFGKI